MKHKLSLIFVCLIMMLSIVVPAAIFLENYTKEKIIAFERSELKHVAKAVQYALPEASFNSAANDHNERINQSLAGLAVAMETRIALIDSQGKLLADSAQVLASVAENDNLASRPEVQQAQLNGEGYSIRPSELVGHDVMHVSLRLDPREAAKIFPDAQSIVIRVTRPLSLIEETINGLHNELLKVGLAIALLAILMSVAGVLYLSRQMQRDSDSLEARVEDRTEEVVLLQMLGSLLNTCASLDEAAKILTELGPKLLPNVSGGISIYKASRNRLDLLCQWGGDFTSEPSLIPHECWALRKGHQHHALNRGVYLPCEHWQGENRETMCIPLLAQGETVGVLHLNYPHSDQRMQPSHVREAIAEQTGLTLANIQLRQQLREQARRDPMTNLYNRLHLKEEMENFYRDKANAKAPSAVLMLDVDHFKRFNDNFGHDAGDLVLKAIAQEIRRATEPHGIACRYGGEEFCVFVVNEERSVCQSLAETIRQAIADLSLSMNNLPLGTVTISIGIAFGPEHSHDDAELITLADSALYSAKEAGRDKVVVYQSQSNLQPLKEAS